MKENQQYKVLYLINHSVPYGANKALLNILDEVVLLGIRPFVVMSFEGAMCIELEKRNIKYQIIEHYFSIYPRFNSIRDIFLFIPRIFRSLWFNYQAEMKLCRIVKEFKPDLIHTNIGPDHIGFHVAKRLDIPHVWHIREYQDLDFDMTPFFSKNYFMKKLQNPNNKVIAITKGIFNHFSMHNNSRVIYDGVLKANNINFQLEKEKYFLFVGRLEEAKGIKTLIEAFVEFCICESEFELRIAGDGESNYKKELEQIINDANLTSRVHFLGFRDDVTNLMAKATALVVPSRYEGFGFITVEAMFNGCLVIGNNCGGTKEILEEKNLGILYSGHNELLIALKTLVTNGIESYYPMLMEAQKTAVALYSQEQNGKAIFEVYQEIICKNDLKSTNV
jgi:glycosyltransferase involved in cell wall biosynthesis